MSRSATRRCLRRKALPDPALNGFDSRCCAYGVALAVLTEMRLPDAQGRLTLRYPEGYTRRRWG